jgi:hypothetical protein
MIADDARRISATDVGSGGVAEIKTVPNHWVCLRATTRRTMARCGGSPKRKISRSRFLKTKSPYAFGGREAFTYSPASPPSGISPSSVQCRPMPSSGTCHASAALAFTDVGEAIGRWR